jgi:hypothetical protein
MSVKRINPENSLSDNDQLWRYMKLSTFFLLLEGRAFFPSVATLRQGDPLEGDIVASPGSVIEALFDKLGEKSNPEESNRLKVWLENKRLREENWFAEHGGLQKADEELANAFVRELAKRRAVWCWHKSDTESAAMWHIYGNAGIAVQTFLGDLEAAMPNEIEFQVAAMCYSQRDDPCSPFCLKPEVPENKNLLTRPHLVKGLEYASEQEVRIVTSCLPPCLSSEPGRLVNGVHNDLIRGVVISPLLPYEEAKAIESQINKHNWQNRKPLVRRSSVLGWHARKQEDRAKLREESKDTGAILDAEQGLPPPLDQL